MADRAHAAAQSVWSRDRLILLLGLLGLSAVAWVHLMSMNPSGDAMAGMARPMAEQWDVVRAGSLLTMWMVMMVAMMLPSAIPAVLLFQRVTGRSQAKRHRMVLFVLGYLLVWSGYAVVATGMQWALHELALLSPTDALVSPVLGGAVMMGAGIYQFLPLKHTCLVRCQSPLKFFIFNWREGAVGALGMGLRHGAACVGCCWSLMALLFVGGVMNPLWVAALSMLVLTEKLLARGRWLSYGIGALLIGWGTAVTLWTA